MTAVGRARALMVVESYWGNTAALAQVVVDGLRDAGVEVAMTDAAHAPQVVGGDIALLLIGAPTHNMSLPNAASRRIAASRGVTADGPGVREWIEGFRLEGSPVIYAFDTHASRFSGSAARAIVKTLRRRRVNAEVGQGFVIAGEPPVLVDGELRRAAAWATALVQRWSADVGRD